MKLDNRIASFASVGQFLLVLCMNVGILPHRHITAHQRHLKDWIGIGCCTDSRSYVSVTDTRFRGQAATPVHFAILPWNGHDAS